MTLYYYQTNIYCILILLIIYMALRNRSGTYPMRRVVFVRLLICSVVVCITDIFAWSFSGKFGSGVHLILHVSNAIYYAAITVAGYIWLCYVELRVRSADFNYSKHRKIMAIPMVIMLIIIAVNPFTGFLFSIDGQNIYSRESGVIVHWIISWFYLLYATFEVIVRIKRSTSRAERNKYLPMLWFIVFPIIAAALQMIIFGITSTQGGMTLGIMIVAINYLIDEVSKDTLTGLNNRRALENTMMEYLQKENAIVTVFMCDVDKFKSINDTLGHAAGDAVLKRMSDALKKTCGESQKSLMLCRYGGDEFVICGIDLSREEIDGLLLGLEKNFEDLGSEYENTLHIGISAGAATGICEKYEDIEALIKKADQIMYEKKRIKRNS